MTTLIKSNSTAIAKIARIGFISKGIIYCLIGLIALMAAFHLGGKSSQSTNTKGILSTVQQLPAGDILLAILTVGLTCYFVWRIIQAFTDTESKGTKMKGIAIRVRYILSGLVYLSFAIIAFKLMIHEQSGGNGNQQFVAELLNKPLGQILVGIVAAIMAAIGLYQLNYGIRNKYKKHLDKLHSNSQHVQLLFKAGTIGYIARGVVWLVVSYLMFNAALHSNSKEAGDTGKAFQFVQDSSLGKYLVALLAIGLILYGIFNFIRSRYENFEGKV